MNTVNSQSFLATILEYKLSEELPRRKREMPLAEIRRIAEATAEPAKDLAQALYRRDGRVALIAEVKRASPSKGDLVTGNFRPLEIAHTYETNGASAISVLTEERFFKGSLQYLTQIKQNVTVPVLRKDFIIDPYQIYEARAAGADAVLLIVAALVESRLVDLHSQAIELGLTPLVEVHDVIEVDRAIKVGARVIGVNNRDLKSFITDKQTTARCAARIVASWPERPLSPDEVVSHLPAHLIVSESGIFTPRDVRELTDMGACAVLVGESIITSTDIAAQVQALAGVQRTPIVPAGPRLSQT